MAEEVINKTFHTIRYMGNKEKLLSFIIPEIERYTNKGDIVCDLMAGTNSIGYALRDRNVIYSNDIQYYSFVLANAMLRNNNFNVDEIKTEFEDRMKSNCEHNYIYDNYKDTYFSGKQCKEIDSIRNAVDKESEEYKYILLSALMIAMCKCQSTTGHFAQYLEKNHERVKPLRKMSIINEFFYELKKFEKITGNNKKNCFYNLEVMDFLNSIDINKIGCFYLDPPYTHDQYSRFYHLLETVCKYDNPDLKFKAKYRTDRFMSDFCYSRNVSNAFENIFEVVSSCKKPIVVSYSNRGVIDLDDLQQLSKKYFKNVNILTYNYKHSSQGKGGISVREVLLTLV